MNTKKILCPVDFSDSSRAAFELAVRLTRKGGSLTLMNVLEPIRITPPNGGFTLRPIYDEMAQEAEREVARYKIDAACLAPAVAVDSVVLLGTPWDEVVRRAKHGYDLVVMGTHGRTGLAHVFVGSVAERVVRHAPCPVLVARAPTPASFRSILCPIDFSEASRQAVRAAAELAGTVGAHLTLLHVYARRPALEDREIEAEVGRLRPVLAEWELDARVWGAPQVQVAWEEGVPWQAIVRRAAERQHDLIAVGTHGRTGLQHVLVGSVAERVVRHAPCSVLAVRGPRR